MSLLHKRRAVIERMEAAGGKRGPRPVEFKRSSAQPPVDYERPAASTRGAPAPAVKPAPKKKAKRARKG